MNVPLEILMWFGRIFYAIIGRIRFFLSQVEQMSRLIWQTASRLHLARSNISVSIEQMYAIGVTSLPLVSVIAVFLGSVTVTQVVYQFGGIIPLRYVGPVFCKSMITELAPVVTSMVVSGRITTAIAAEIGSMKATEQIDAMTILSLDPVRYLIVPKTIACIIMLPLLVIWAELLAFLGSIVTVFLTIDMTLYSFTSGLRMFFFAKDLYVGIAKTMVFGGIIALTGSYFGMNTRGGAEGVGNATTRAVLLASVLILIFDFLIAFTLLR